MRRVIVALAFVFAASVQSGAQIIRRGSYTPPPTTWVSGGVGYLYGWGLTDGTTGSTWDFGDATQFNASIDRQFIPGATIGLRGMTARVPLRYVSSAGTASDADANISQLLATVYAAGNQSVHSVLSLDAGATMFSNFRERGTNATLAPTSDVDFTFGIGYGFGFNLSPRFAVDVVQTNTMIMHQTDNLSAGSSSLHRTSGTRIVARFGLGG